MRQRAAQQASWRAAHARQRQPPRIDSAAEELDSSAFARRVLAADQWPGGQPWVVQLYAHDSPFCRALSSQWEAAVKEAGTLLSFGRISFHEQPMLVRFVASHLRRLFRSPHPWRELPVVFGLPRGCYSMRCAVVFTDQLTSQALQRWAGTHLLRLRPLPPLSSRLLGHWCRALPAGQLGVLAVVREGQPQPLHLLEEISKAQGSVRAAAAVWRSADRAVWQSAIGAASPPLLVLCKGTASNRHLVTVRSSSLTDSSAWAAELRRHAGPDLSQGPSRGNTRPAGLLALAAAHALLAALHAASWLELAARRCSQGLRDVGGDISWQQWATAALGLASLWAFKRLLDAFSATDDEFAAAGSPVKKPARRAAASSSETLERMLPLGDTQAAVLRLEDILGGGGSWLGSSAR
ncbi:heat shock amino-terminal domain [Chlorella sorokiniana]|uniref:Heat shock amino-terminal domain n=1 Tax=Chlorella sorokiniana TaxID=3076 RepID=A0A2P6U1W1_CHLSO|nr:heat shock amino-terminal domain [Chlorella sorokiniana]|eukprot:PRW60306.1 heat shock amino-terminal domain [Chlorella sorokiniana]